MLQLFVVCAALAACVHDSDETSEHVDFIFEDTSRQLCAGSLPHLNGYVERALNFFDEPVPEDFVVPVRVMANPPCTQDACYKPNAKEVYTAVLDRVGARTSGVLRHELSHAVIGHVWGSSIPFFGEGLAEALSPSADWVNTSAEVVPVAGMLASEAEGVDYTAAARFIRFLIDTRGLDNFKRMFQAGNERSEDAIHATFLEVYGEDFAALEAEFLAGPPRCMFQVDICDAERAEPVGSGWSRTFAASCADPDFYGSIGSEDQNIATQRTILVEAAGSYHLSTSSPVVLARCGDCEQQFIPTRLYGGVDLELDEGLYTLEFMLTADTVVTLELVPEAVAP